MLNALRRNAISLVLTAVLWTLALVMPAPAAQNAVQISTGSPLPGLTLVNDINAANTSLTTLQSGTSAPTTTSTGLSALAGMLWHDTTTNCVKIRDQADANWLPIFCIDETGKYVTPVAPLLANSGNEAVSGTNHPAQFVATGAATYTLAQTSTLVPGFAFAVLAQGGNVTLSINGSDVLSVNGTSLSAGTGSTIPFGFVGVLDTDGAGNWYLRLEPASLGTGTVASASTADLCSVPNPYVSITGTTTITSFGSTCQAGQVKILSFASTPQITYNGTSMILPGGASVTALAGATGVAVALGSGNWKVINFTNGAPLFAAVQDQTLSGGANLSDYSIGTITSSTTIDCGKGPSQQMVNNGSITINAPTSSGQCDVQVVNGPSAGTPTMSGFNEGSNTGDAFSASARSTTTVTITNASPAVVTWTAHGLPAGWPIWFTTSSSLPAGLTASTVYYICNNATVATNTFEVCPNPGGGGTPINTSSAGSGTQTGVAASVYYLFVTETADLPRYWFGATH